MLVILLLNQQMLYEAEQIVVILWAHGLFRNLFVHNKTTTFQCIFRVLVFIWTGTV